MPGQLHAKGYLAMRKAPESTLTLIGFYNSLPSTNSHYPWESVTGLILLLLHTFPGVLALSFSPLALLQVELLWKQLSPVVSLHFCLQIKDKR